MPAMTLATSLALLFLINDRKNSYPMERRQAIHMPVIKQFQ